MRSRGEEKTAIRRGPGGNKTKNSAGVSSGRHWGGPEHPELSSATGGLFDLCSDAASAPKRRLIVVREDKLSS